MTDLTLEWLSHSATAATRVQDTDFNILDFTIQADGKVSTTPAKTSPRYWTRRGREQHTPKVTSNSAPQNRPLSNYLFQDDLVVSQALEQTRKKRLGIHHTGSFFGEKDTNKLTNLTLAGAAGLQVPVTCVTNHKKTLRRFLESHPTVITKDLRAPVNLQLKDGFLASTGVTTVRLEDIADMADHFAPTLVQAYTPKAFEIRTFIFRCSLFSMAIFSQNDEQTTIDFRNYNQQRPNRCVPFQLPEAIEQKLLKFMKLAELDTGSVDLIYTPAGEYVFLEVNPMGQFHWLSENCNYYLERFIAEQLAQT